MVFGRFLIVARLDNDRFCFFPLFSGNVPCPILYGAVVDSACLIWEMTCGKKGSCSLYDSDSFRIFYHGKYL